MLGEFNVGCGSVRGREQIGPEGGRRSSDKATRRCADMIQNEFASVGRKELAHDGDNLRAKSGTIEGNENAIHGLFLSSEFEVDDIISVRRTINAVSLEGYCL